MERMSLNAIVVALRQSILGMSSGRFALTVIILGLAIRIGAIALYDGRDYFGGISRSYEEIARNALEGRGFSNRINIAPVGEPSQMEYVPFITRPLGYGVFLAAIYGLLGVEPTAVQGVQALMNALACLLTYGIGRRIFGEWAGRLAALVHAAWPVSVRFDIALLPDAMVSIFLLASTYAVVRSLERDGVRWYLLAGLLTGLSIAFKPNGAFIAMFFAAFLWLSRRTVERFLKVSALVLMSALLILPNALRMYEATGAFRPFGLGLGISLWQGLSDFGPMHGTILDDDSMSVREGYPNWAFPKPIEREDARTAYAIDVIRNHPMWYTGVMLRRIPLLLTVHPGLFVSPSPHDYAREYPGSSLGDYIVRYPLNSAVTGLIILSSYLILLLAAWSLWVHRSGWSTAWIPLVVPLCFILLHVIQHTESRYFLPAIPHVLILAAGFVCRPGAMEQSGKNWSSRNNDEVEPDQHE